MSDTEVPGDREPNAAGRRVVVVLGYSDEGSGELHRVCRARLDHAARISGPEDVVVLSGWARVPHSPSEASLMRAAWKGAAARVVVDEDARTTAENAANAVSDILAAGASDVVVVTSDWHAARARAAFRWLLRGAGISVAVEAVPLSGSRRDRLRELALWPLLPAQLHRARHRGRAGAL